MKKQLEEGKSQDIRVDLDIHFQNLTESYGWDTDYRSEERDILFSGDRMEAPLPQGASELYYVKRKVNDMFVLSLNNYTETGTEVPFELVVAKAETDLNEDKLSHYTLDPNEIILSIPMKMDANENMRRLGFVKFEEDRITFVFNSFNTLNRIVSDNANEVFANSLNYLESYKETALDLKQLLRDSKAVLCDRDEAETDLSLEALDKESFIKMFTQAGD